MIKAKFKVDKVVKYERQESVTMTPVYSSDPKSENYSFSQATPSGELTLNITNPEVFGVFEPGKEFLIDFTPAT